MLARFFSRQLQNNCLSIFFVDGSKFVSVSVTGISKQVSTTRVFFLCTTSSLPMAQDQPQTQKEPDSSLTDDNTSKKNFVTVPPPLVRQARQKASKKASKKRAAPDVASISVNKASSFLLTLNDFVLKVAGKNGHDARRREQNEGELLCSSIPRN
jgi:hypothetical protein